MKTEWKMLFTATLAALSSYMQAIAVPLLILLGVMILDFAAGTAKAWVLGEVSSREGIKGAARKVGRMCLVTVGMVVDYLLAAGLESVKIELPFQMPFALLVTFWLIISECISIVENLSATGVPIPPFLERALAQSKDRLNSNTNYDTNHEEKEETIHESD